MSRARKPYPSDVTDDAWAFAAPDRALVRGDAHRRRHDPREVLHPLRSVAETGAEWRDLPSDSPPRGAVHPQARRWPAARAREHMAGDLRAVLRVAGGRGPQPSAAALDGRAVPPTPESGARAGYDGRERRGGSTVRAGVDTLGSLVALRGTAAGADDRDPVAALAAEVRGACGPAADAASHGIGLMAVRRAEPKRGLALLPRRRVVERSFAWLARFGRLARDYGRTAGVLTGWHWVAFVALRLRRATVTLPLPVPCRVRVLDARGALAAIGAASADRLAVRPGVVYTADGTARIPLSAGEYTVHAGRGFEYGLATIRVALRPGDTLRKGLTIRREVPTPGYVACDPHVHSRTQSGHGDSTAAERAVTLACEGVELPVAADHNTQADYRPAVAAAGVGGHLTPVIGNEVTTAAGHFNVFPLPAGGPPPDHRGKDWKAVATARGPADRGW